ncbi:MAG: hypothetical protein M1482_14025 [Chloroflexi bacterium]|nr:hypothetical protein [Chloroflexota bacterium]
MENRLIGSYLVNEGVITREQLDEALVAQAEHKGTSMPLIGTVLLKMGAINEDDLTFALAEQERDRMRVTS